MAKMVNSKRRQEEKARAQRMRAHKESLKPFIEARKCPQCGGGIHRNLALAGWWQCDRFGAPGFKRVEGQGDCSWQDFYTTQDFY